MCGAVAVVEVPLTTTWVGLGILGFVVLFFALPSIPDLLGPLVTRRSKRGTDDKRDGLVKLRILEALDSAAHALRLPGCGWLCDRLDLAYGLTWSEIRRTRDEFEACKNPANQRPAGPPRRRSGR